jgi:two-component system, sensor histidine kinase and response regulator
MTRETQGRVLVVEDDGLVAHMVQSLMQQEGYEVVDVVGDGRAALEAVAQHRPDIVVMDLQMPGMDGIQATRRIQEICPTPVVVLTAHDDLQLTEEAARAGVGAYLVKPPNGRSLARAIMVARARFEETQTLSVANADLSEQNRDLDAFAHTVAHDLKSGLQPIVGLAQLLREELEEIPVEHAQRYLELISGDGKRLGRVVDDILLLAEVRDRELPLQRLDMADLIAESQARLAQMIEEWEAEIVLPQDWPAVQGYGPWVVEVWVNYLSNAIKYGGLPPRVEVGWAVASALDAIAPESYRFWVRDNGTGLTPGEQTQLFAPFTQLSPTGAEGHGLGLSIVRRIIEKLGGRVGVESVVGRGSTFWFTLTAAGEGQASPDGEDLVTAQPAAQADRS